MKSAATTGFEHALADAYLRACEVELQALKPGNVSMDSPGHEMCADDFMESARVSAVALVAPDLSLGERIYRAIAATRETVACNTNLGIVLLCAPLLHAMLTRPPAGGLRARLREVLDAAGVQDTEWIYRAIRLAAPGGLGRSEVHDVQDAPAAPVMDVMRAGAQRDRVALQYVTGYADVFMDGLPRLVEYRARWKSDAWAAVAVFLSLLARFPDSHVARKFGWTHAREVSAEAARLEAELSRCVAPQEIIRRLQQTDAEFKSAGINPGTTADLTVACLAVFYLERLISTDSRDLSSSKAQGAFQTDGEGAAAPGGLGAPPARFAAPYRVSP
jgi:triphosphoribosyl-dephospho-CoA synthase